MPLSQQSGRLVLSGQTSWSRRNSAIRNSAGNDVENFRNCARMPWRNGSDRRIRFRRRSAATACGPSQQMPRPFPGGKCAGIPPACSGKTSETRVPDAPGGHAPRRPLPTLLTGPSMVHATDRGPASTIAADIARDAPVSRQPRPQVPGSGLPQSGLRPGASMSVPPQVAGQRRGWRLPR